MNVNNLNLKAGKEGKSTRERFLGDDEAKKVGVETEMPTSVDQSSNNNKKPKPSESVTVVDKDDDDLAELDEVQVDAQVVNEPKEFLH